MHGLTRDARRPTVWGQTRNPTDAAQACPCSAAHGDRDLLSIVAEIGNLVPCCRYFADVGHLAFFSSLLPAFVYTSCPGPWLPCGVSSGTSFGRWPQNRQFTLSRLIGPSAPSLRVRPFVVSLGSAVLSCALFSPRRRSEAIEHQHSCADTTFT